MEKQVSLTGKQWTDAPQAEGLEWLCEYVLAQKGIEFYDDMERFLYPTTEQLHDPWEMKDMHVAVERIQHAIENKERIIVYGDFDTDGVTSTVILVSALQELGGMVSYRIPHREKDSHGLKKYILDEIAEKKVGLVITCDCGINDMDEVAYGAELGMDIIVTDHHESDPKRYPKKACAVVNTLQEGCAYPDKNLSGAGIALKLIMALSEQMIEDEEKREVFLEKYIEMCGIGLVADCMQLVGENRVLAKMALEKMQKTKWKGLEYILSKAEVVRESINEETIGFVIAPKINAASRVGDVMVAAQLFLGMDAKIPEKVDILDVWNDKRRNMTQEYMAESQEQIQPDAPCQCLYNPEWKAGILGLVAGRHCEALGVPVITMSDKPGGKVGASCRAPEGYHMEEALRSCGELFTHFGGHEGAAGFVAPKENKEKIIAAVTEFFAKQEHKAVPRDITAWVDNTILDGNLLQFLDHMRPFGAGNPQPVLGIQNITVTDIKMLGQQQNHARIKGTKDGEHFEWMGFFWDHVASVMQVGMRYDIAFTVSANYWNGTKNLQLRMVDVRPVVGEK